jgi:hypothetical protein
MGWATDEELMELMAKQLARKPARQKA